MKLIIVHYYHVTVYNVVINQLMSIDLHVSKEGGREGEASL